MHLRQVDPKRTNTNIMVARARRHNFEFKHYFVIAVPDKNYQQHVQYGIPLDHFAFFLSEEFVHWFDDSIAFSLLCRKWYVGGQFNFIFEMIPEEFLLMKLKFM